MSWLEALGDSRRLPASRGGRKSCSLAAPVATPGGSADAEAAARGAKSDNAMDDAATRAIAEAAARGAKAAGVFCPGTHGYNNPASAALQPQVPWVAVKAAPKNALGVVVKAAPKRPSVPSYQDSDPLFGIDPWASGSSAPHAGVGSSLASQRGPGIPVVKAVPKQDSDRIDPWASGSSAPHAPKKAPGMPVPRAVPKQDSDPLFGMDPWAGGSSVHPAPKRVPTKARPASARPAARGQLSSVADPIAVWGPWAAQAPPMAAKIAAAPKVKPTLAKPPESAALRLSSARSHSLFASPTLAQAASPEERAAKARDPFITWDPWAAKAPPMAAKTAPAPTVKPTLAKPPGSWSTEPAAPLLSSARSHSVLAQAASPTVSTAPPNISARSSAERAAEEFELARAMPVGDDSDEDLLEPPPPSPKPEKDLLEPPPLAPTPAKALEAKQEFTVGGVKTAPEAKQKFTVDDVKTAPEAKREFTVDDIKTIEKSVMYLRSRKPGEIAKAKKVLLCATTLGKTAITYFDLEQLRKYQ
eukprot:TRINITY_DN11283_c0_g1_i2.p1 TRINITY_DN11283_c0_g1~~TRINITY_DN11283_c0_g1_i2.p1  ORF type:complete len:529 (-),score=98.45 TRINITY_DN11283_c0_g1_i2:48-1634(-)